MEQNAIQKVLRSEITWMVFFFGCIWGFVTTVVLPLQRVQITLAQVQVAQAQLQVDLNSQNKKFDIVNASISAVSSRTSVLEAELKDIFKN